jgi:hypothetical protein
LLDRGLNESADCGGFQREIFAFPGHVADLYRNIRKASADLIRASSLRRESSFQMALQIGLGPLLSG